MAVQRRELELGVPSSRTWTYPEPGCPRPIDLPAKACPSQAAYLNPR